MGIVERRRSRSGTKPIRGIGTFCHQLTVHPGGYPSKRIMRPKVVIIIHKYLRYFPYFFKIVEQIGIQYRLAVRLVEPLDLCILCRLAGLDVFEPDLVHFTPLLCYFGHKFRAVVHTDVLWFSIPVDKVFQYPNYPAALQ